MAIMKLRTYEEVATRILAEKAYRSVREVENDLEKINDTVTDSLALLKAYQKNIERSGSAIIVNVGEPAPKNSPRAPGGAKPELVKNLEKNFIVIQSLNDARTSLETLEAKLRTSSKTLGGDANQALKSLEVVRKKVFKGLQDALTFVSSEAIKTMPEEFSGFTDKLKILVSRSMTYESVNTFAYMFVNNGTTLCYSTYMQLKDLIDDKGNRLPELFVVASLDLGKSRAENKYYLDILFEFEPPSNKLLTSAINPNKMADVANSLADLLNVSHFANTIQRIPIRLLISPESLTRDLFSYSEYIDTIEVPDDGSNQINFWLKPDVTDKPLIDDIAKQLYLDFKGLASSTNAHLRTAFPMKKKGGVTRQVITFFVIRQSGSPAANPEDLDFLKERFNLNDGTVARILQTINKE
jgi:hypothetical protein